MVKRKQKDAARLVALMGGIFGHELRFDPRMTQPRNNHRPWLKKKKGRA